MEQGKKRRGPYRTYNKLVKAGKLPFPRSFLPEILKAEREAELKRTLQKESEGRGSSSRPNIEEPRGRSEHSKHLDTALDNRNYSKGRWLNGCL
jgi:hypothetical protein